MDSSKDLYAVLGLSRDASADEVKKAYRKLARRYHPDVNPGDKQAEERFKQVSEANEILTDPKKRKLYDEFGMAGLQAGFDPEQAYSARAGRQHARQGDDPFAHGDFAGYAGFDDILGDLFGRGQTGSAARSGEDIEASLEIDLLEAVRGLSPEITINRPVSCSTCGGSGAEATSERTCTECKGAGKVGLGRGPLSFERVCPNCNGRGRISTKSCSTCGGDGRVAKTERLKVKIPAGVATGSRIRLSGKGGDGTPGAPPGDLYIVVRVRPHDRIERQGDDLYMNLPVTVGEALLGATANVPTPHGEVRVKIPAGSQAGKLLRIRNHGVPKMGGGETGNLYLRLQVMLPARVDESAKAAIDTLESAYETHPRSDFHL